MEDSLPLRGFPSLVILADKYQCMGAVRPWFVSAITQYFTSSIDEKPSGFDKLHVNLGTIMCIAYAVGDAQLFWRFSRSAVARLDTLDFNRHIDSALLDLMPEGFTGTSVEGSRISSGHTFADPY